jgi:hypothetical protein
MGSRFANELADFNPRSWLKRYRLNSPLYLVKMLLFYHGIGIVLLLAGTFLVDQLFPGRQEPSVPRSLSGVLSAGPLEETVFFGLPFYILGNPYSMLVTGSFWAALHLLNTTGTGVSQLAFGNFLFAIPTLFFSLRTWLSGKGWFSVLVHSGWNGIFFASGCAADEFTCLLLDNDRTSAAASIALSCALLGVTYYLYRRRAKREASEQLAS